MIKPNIKAFLTSKAEQFNQPFFIENDPISIPHLFSKKQDIEIAGFFASIFAWGNRTTIINKSKELMQMMDDAPHDFIVNHKEKDLKRFLNFKHRTFNATDLLYFIGFLSYHYKNSASLETAFVPDFLTADNKIEKALIHFNQYFFSLEFVPERTRKHIATPLKNSTCKRLNMFLRWMVRNDDKGVDFGIWKSIKPAELICPIDLHVARVARSLGILKRSKTDWIAAMELTEVLREIDPSDPVKFDFALFGAGVMEKYR